MAHLQKNLPAVVQEVFAGDERRVAPVPAEPVPLPKKSKFAVLHWEPRSQARANADVGSQSETANSATQ